MEVNTLYVLSKNSCVFGSTTFEEKRTLDYFYSVISSRTKVWKELRDLLSSLSISAGVLLNIELGFSCPLIIVDVFRLFQPYVSWDRVLLDRLLPPEPGKDQDPGPSIQGEQQVDDGDYSPSVSSWEPSDNDSSADDSDEVKNKRVKIEYCKRQYTNRKTSKKVIVPSHRANAVIPTSMQKQQAHRTNSTNKSTIMRKEFDPDSTRQTKSPTPSFCTKGVNLKTITVNIDELKNMKETFLELFKVFNDLKPLSKRYNFTDDHTGTQYRNPENLPIPKGETQRYDDKVWDGDYNTTIRDEDVERSQSEDSNRSDDNVLITNKYESVETKTVKNKSNSDENEWVPIGSGKTLIHRDQYRKVNWKSYTIATRSLLLAVFPRRILATHSLTGKRSPAFHDKPAKMCLDPKIVMDVIIEITDRFNVKENLVRSIITTKCADECKMYKMRLKKKKDTMNIASKENMAPRKKIKEETNQTNKTSTQV